MSKLWLRKACCPAARKKRGAGPAARLWQIGADGDVNGAKSRKKQSPGHWKALNGCIGPKRSGPCQNLGSVSGSAQQSVQSGGDGREAPQGGNDPEPRFCRAVVQHAFRSQSLDMVHSF